jgi:uncharacterized OsmC-like protein
MHPVRLEAPIGDDDHVRGRATAPVTLVEYGDFARASCAMAHPIVKALERRFGDDVRYVYRHAPQATEEPLGEAAAEACEAAGAQGRFFEMVDLLCAEGPALDTEALVDRAEILGLDVDRFRRDLETHAFAHAVRQSALSGAHTVIGAPTFFVNGVRFEDALDESTLGAAVERALHEVRGDAPLPALAVADDDFSFFRTRVCIGDREIVCDEPEGLGGSGEGAEPRDLVAAALAACTAMYVRHHARQLGLPPLAVRVTVRRSLDHGMVHLHREVEVQGAVDDEAALEVLHRAAEHDPVGRMLLGGATVTTSFAGARAG